MLFGKTKLELKVGIFVFIGLVILITFILFIGDFRTWTLGYNNINFVFRFINGVKIGAPVRFAGVDIGEVKKIDFIVGPQDNKTNVQITGWIRKDIKIPRDSNVWVNTLGLLGEKYIEIIPGLDYSKCLVSNDTLDGADPIAMHEVGNLVKSIATDIDETVLKIKNSEGTFGRLLDDDTVYKEIEALVKDLRVHPWKLFWKTREKAPKK